MNGASAVVPIDGSIAAPYVDVQTACDTVANQGTVLVGVGAYAGPVTITGKVIHITGQGNAEGGPGGNAAIGGFDLTASFVRLQSLALTAGITVNAGAGALFGYNVTPAGFAVAGAGTSTLTLALVSDGLDLSSAWGPIDCNTLRAKNQNFGGPVAAAGFVIASDGRFQDTLDGATGILINSVLEGDVTFSGEADFIDCSFLVASPINIAAAPLRMDAVSYGRAVAAGCTFAGAVTLLDGSDGIRNQSGVLGATVTAALDALAAGIAGFVPTSRTLTAGAGLTGGGDLSADRTFNVVGNADGSILANANDVQVGVLATDAQHGNRGGGGIHATAVAGGAAGFMSGADKTKLDGLPTSAVPTTRTITAGAGLTGGGDLSADRTLNVVGNADGSILANADDVQVGVLATDAQHGNRGGGGIHSNAVSGGAAGFMSGADKLKLDQIIQLTQGANLGDANTTIAPDGGTEYNLPANTYSGNRNITLGTTSARASLIMGVNVYDVNAFSKTFVNGGAGGGNLLVISASDVEQTAWFIYDGTNWSFLCVGFL